ncbi:beta-xylanase [Acrocarpospora phusangensis]|uniref:Beta-xylanase n=1 Tax=Acrocarpospora phusangensis TaxID=1070424 RepID=A0A919QCQ3_9ACTN|nr:endo-1,4-beta-xylanase [Acrocarpospora phusangensis]GIH26804.1 beta-xylanase [Acrocarpospora phusangensis]
MRTARYWVIPAFLGLLAGLLAPPALAAPVTIASYDFETSAGGWAPRGGGVTVATTADAAHGGARSLSVTGRSANWHGTSITPPFEKGITYNVTAWARALPGQPSSTVALTMERTPSGGSTTYERIGAATVTDAAWVEISGAYSFSVDSTLNLYFESSGDTVAFYLDDVVVSSDSDPTQSGLVTDFETGAAQGWAPRGSATLAASTAAAHAGSYGLAVSNRSASWDGPARNILGKMAKGSKYALEVWVRTATAQNLGLSIERRLAGTPSYERVAAPTPIAAGVWTKLSGTYTLAHDIDFLSAYVESDTGTLPFDIDDFSLTYIAPKPIQTDIPSLKDTVPFTLGAAFYRGATLGEHAKLINKHYDSVTPGNALKWDATEPSEGVFTFDEGDALVDFATDNDLEFRGHTLVWHSQTPAWVFAGATKEILLQRIENHIRAVMGRYKGRIGTWDVVNEVIDENQPDGLRRSPWFEIAGLDYIRTAFRVAREVDPDATLVFNDYNTEFPRKREAMFKVVKQLRQEGVPIDAVGHQLHVNIEQAPASWIESSIERFAQLGVEQQVTELDVSVYTDFVNSYATVPAEVLAEQGYRYKEIFDVFRRQASKLSSVTIWGVADDATWLSTFPITRLNPPLPFDDELQAKPAFWGIADPSQLPPLLRKLNAPAASIQVDGKRDLAWDYLPDAPIARVGDVSAGFQARSTATGLYVLAEVSDASYSTNDSVTFTVGGTDYRVRRNGQHAPGFTADVKWTSATGYRVEARLPSGSATGVKVVVDDATGPETSWNGTVTALPAIKTTSAPKAKTAPVIDGAVDSAWSKAQEITTGTWVQGSSGATAKVKALWKDGTLYVLARVTDPVLSEESPNAYEEDSVEIFVDPENNKNKGYDDDDGQYRISFTNHQTIGGTFDAFGVRDNLTSAVSLTPTGYLVEAAIELPTVTLAKDALLGFDVQVNDATGPARTAAVTWNDPTGQSYVNTSRWGVLQLAK